MLLAWTARIALFSQFSHTTTIRTEPYEAAADVDDLMKPLAERSLFLAVFLRSLGRRLPPTREFACSVPLPRLKYPLSLRHSAECIESFLRKRLSLLNME